LEYFKKRLQNRSFIKELNENNKYEETIKEYMTPQQTLVKVTKDRNTILENKNRKNNMFIEKIIFPSTQEIFEKINDPDLVSRNLLKLINFKYELCKENINCLDENEFIQEKLHYEEIKDICFTPSIHRLCNEEINNISYSNFKKSYKGINDSYKNELDMNKNLIKFDDNIINENSSWQNFKTYRYGFREEERCFVEDKNDDFYQENISLKNHGKFNNKIVTNDNSSNYSFSTDQFINKSIYNFQNNNNYNENIKTYNLNINNFIYDNNNLNFNNLKGKQNDDYFLKNKNGSVNYINNLPLNRFSEVFINKGNTYFHNNENKVDFVNKYLSNEEFTFLNLNKEKSKLDKLTKAQKIISEFFNIKNKKNYLMYSESNFRLNSSIEIIKDNLGETSLINELKVK